MLPVSKRHLTVPCAVRQWRRHAVQLSLAWALCLVTAVGRAEGLPPSRLDDIKVWPFPLFKGTATPTPELEFQLAGRALQPVGSMLLPAMSAAVEAGQREQAASTRKVDFSRWIKDHSDEEGKIARHAVPEAEIRRAMAGALQQAVTRSPLLLQAMAESAAAHEDLNEAEGQRWPQVDLEANSRAAALGGSSDAYPRRQGASLNMTTNIFDWGRTGKNIDSHRLLATAANRKYAAYLETLASDVCSSIAERERNRRVVSISQQYVDRMATLVGMLREIVAVDRGRASELTQARARLLEAEAGRDSAAARKSDIDIHLRKLIGDSPIALSDDRDWALKPAELQTLLAAVDTHPSLLQAEATAQAAELNAEALKAAQKPKLDWVINKTTAKDALGREQSWQTMVTMSWPLFRGGAMRAAQSAASLRAVAERQRKAQQALDLQYDIRSADESARALLARANLYRDLSKETDRVRKAFFEQWYHLGKRTLLDVLVAESDHHNHRVNEVNSRYDGYLAVLRGYSRAGHLGAWLRGDGSPALP